MASCREGVRGAHSTDEGGESRQRERAPLWSRLCLEVSARACPQGPTTRRIKCDNSSAGCTCLPNVAGSDGSTRSTIGSTGVTSWRKRGIGSRLETIRLNAGRTYRYVVDGDIKSYFDSISHEKLLKLVEQRISDRRVLKLLRQWLKAGVMEEGALRGTELGSPRRARQHLGASLSTSGNPRAVCRRLRRVVPHPG